VAGERLPLAKFHLYRGNVSPLRSEKPIFGPLSKCSIGMAALRTRRPASNDPVSSVEVYRKRRYSRSTAEAKCSHIFKTVHGNLCDNISLRWLLRVSMTREKLMLLPGLYMVYSFDQWLYVSNSCRVRYLSCSVFSLPRYMTFCIFLIGLNLYVRRYDAQCCRLFFPTMLCYAMPMLSYVVCVSVCLSVCVSVCHVRKFCQNE